MSSSGWTYTLTSQAYTLPLLHAAKYTSSTVLGIFLGKPDESTKSISITDAIPLLHHYTSLSPIAEAGISLIQSYAGERPLVGLYIAHESPGGGLGRVGERVLEVLKDEFQGAFGLVIENAQLGRGDFPYAAYTAAAPSRAVPTAPGEEAGPASTPIGFKLENAAVIRRALEWIRNDGAHRAVVDFDDHVENSDCDWLENQAATQVIKRLSKS